MGGNLGRPGSVCHTIRPKSSSIRICIFTGFFLIFHYTLSKKDLGRFKCFETLSNINFSTTDFWFLCYVQKVLVWSKTICTCFRWLWTLKSCLRIDFTATNGLFNPLLFFIFCWRSYTNVYIHFLEVLPVLPCKLKPL